MAASRPVARSLRDVARGHRIHSLLLSRSEDLVCKNLMCEHVGSSCACKLSLVLERVPDLQEMDLSKNQLRFLPASTFALGKLTHLNVSHNQLDVFPSQLTELKQLQILDIAHNRIASIPAGILAGLHQLQEIRVTGNPLSSDTLKSLRAHHADLKVVE